MCIGCVCFFHLNVCVVIVYPLLNLDARLVRVVLPLLVPFSPVGALNVDRAPEPISIAKSAFSESRVYTYVDFARASILCLVAYGQY